MVIRIVNNLEEQGLDSFKVALKHEEQEPTESKALEIRQSTYKRQSPMWHLEYVTKINVTYCLLIKDGDHQLSMNL